MGYRLHQFSGVSLPLGMARDDLSTGEADTSLVDSIGGAFDIWGATTRFPRKQTISHGGIYSGETTYLVDHTGTQIHDHSGNHIIVGTAAAMLRGKIDALKELIGTQASLTRYREDDAGIQWKTARLLGVRHDQSVADVNVAMLRSTFETTMVGWRYASQSSVAASIPAQAYFVATVGGNLPVYDAIITIAAATTITALTITMTTGVSLAWTGTLSAGTSLVINCGTRTVLNNGANAYSGFSFGVGHTVSNWLPLVVGDNTITATVTGTGTLTLTWYEQYA